MRLLAENRGKDSILELTPVGSAHELLRSALEAGYLLHGSNRATLACLEPQLANCGVKAFGNQIAIYACEDEMIALFFAIRRKGSRFGVVRTTIHLIQTREDISREYSFGISGGLAHNNPWTSGAVYLFARDGFDQYVDESGAPSLEWAAYRPVRPVARIAVGPEDFPLLSHVELL